MTHRGWKRLLKKLGLSPKRRIADERDKLRAVIRSLGVGLCTLDANGHVLSINPAGERLLGYAEVELIGRPFFEEIVPNHAPALEAIATSGQFHCDEDGAFIRKDRTVLPVSYTLNPMFEDQALRGAALVFSDITERKLAEEELNEDEKRFRELFESSPDAIFIEDFEGNVLDVNPAACRLHGIEYEQLIGQNVCFLVPPDKREHALRTFDELVNGKLDRVEGFSWTVDGREAPVEIRVSRITHKRQHALLLHVRDITERKQVEEALRKSEERHRMLLEHLPVGVYRTTLDGCIVEANAAMATLFGVESIAVLQQLTVEDLYLDVSDRKRYLDQLITNDAATAELKLQRVDGEAIWVRNYAHAVRNDQSEVVCFDGILLDITEQKRFEEELIRAKEKAEEISRLKGAFLANMSHEIRTPLTVIIGYANVLAGEIPETYRELVEPIGEGAQRLFETLNSVLDLARLEAGGFELTLEPFDVRVPVYQTVKLFRKMACEKGLDLKIEAPRSPTSIQADRAGIGRILSNLLSNAIKFTEAGSIIVRVSTSAASVQLETEDTGIGMDATFLPHLFDEFKQESTGLKRRHQGAGLGLAITKRLVDLMGGQIEVESTRGHGSRFRLTFPRVEHCIAPKRGGEQNGLHEASEQQIKGANPRFPSCIVDTAS